MDLDVGVESARSVLATAAEVLRVDSHQGEIRIEDMFDQRPILRAEQPAIAQAGGLNVSGLNGQLDEVRGQTLIDQLAQHHAFGIRRVVVRRLLGFHELGALVLEDRAPVRGCACVYASAASMWAGVRNA